MTTYDARLKKREEVAAGTMAFHIEKPAGFTFKPGQAIDVILPESVVADAQNARHTFSIVSSAAQNELTFATRMRDSVFKNALKALPIGTALKIEGPFGSLTLHNNRARSAIFIAGGIGITPFMSILQQAAHDKLPHELILLYANRRPEDSAFLANLQELEQQNAHFRLVCVMSEMAKSSQPWSGETGQIDGKLIQRVVGTLQSPVYYLVGPPAMVEAMRGALNATGVDDDDIRTEEFYGY
ncbi:FAD-dependent oxidoreductase [Paralcaligenes ureilyticus]|uniref:Ferredoxin-NADP reductase n=1 Tax=Paralcaligenes ureilyticus TaxID=627131 RepID=A0A4R3LW33_9BURK|nr:FAD-dependent oxidoreductase [Paralcaligenes ureilyticus]TCT04870.1 ferredoxin-NADP reductase [Paralcaligenes ureilyticus]